MKVYCKKTFSHRKGGKKIPSYFKKGKYYEVYLEFDNGYWLFVDKSKTITHFFNKKNYYKQKNYLIITDDIFEDFFYTEKHLRLKKIKKLYELY